MAQYKTGFVAEEMLTNSDTIFRINPSSLNTVRITTIKANNEVIVAFAFIRFGRAGKCVDNGFSGGLLCNIDINTGIVTSAVDEDAYYYILHPDSGEQIIGFNIPDWQKAVDLSLKLARIVPENRYTGWDLAHTDRGWILVEANCKGQFIDPQMSERRGIKERIDNILAN